MADRLEEVMQQGRSQRKFLWEAVLRCARDCERLAQYGQERARATGIGQGDEAHLVETRWPPWRSGRASTWCSRDPRACGDHAAAYQAEQSLESLSAVSPWHYGGSDTLHRSTVTPDRKSKDGFPPAGGVV